jgi:glycerone phosphate O-acyltransferase/fatty acyl-CoA reductase
MYRRGIVWGPLVQKVDWLRREILKRGGRVEGVEGECREDVVKRGLALLSDHVSLRRNQMYEPKADSRDLYGNLIALGHYRNQIVHMFAHHGIIACALYALSSHSKSSPQGTFGLEGAIEIVGKTDRSKLLEWSCFLRQLLQLEFVAVMPPLSEADCRAEMERALDRMIGESILTATTTTAAVGGAPSSTGKVEVSPSAEGHFSLLCALVWPFIDSYWIAVTTLFALQSPTGMKGISLDNIIQRMQWFAETCYHEGMLEFYESCSKETLGLAVMKLKEMRVLEEVLDSALPKGQGGGGLLSALNKAKGASAGLLVQLRSPFDVAGHKDGHLHALVKKIGLFRKAPLSVRASKDGMFPAGGAGLAADLPILAKM